MSSVRERARQLESDMKKMVLLAISAAGFLAGCERAPTFPEILMTYHDVDWLKTHEDQIPVIVAECGKIVNSELKQSDLPMPVAHNCGGIQNKIAPIERSRKRNEHGALERPERKGGRRGK